MLSGHGSRIIGVVLGFATAHGMQSLQDSFVGELIGTIQTAVQKTASAELRRCLGDDRFSAEIF